MTKYLRSEPQTVVDVGCGIGLSTSIWLNKANYIIENEPNDNMRKVALEKWQAIDMPSIRVNS